MKIETGTMYSFSHHRIILSRISQQYIVKVPCFKHVQKLLFLDLQSQREFGLWFSLFSAKHKIPYLPDYWRDLLVQARCPDAVKPSFSLATSCDRQVYKDDLRISSRYLCVVLHYKPKNNHCICQLHFGHLYNNGVVQPVQSSAICAWRTVDAEQALDIGCLRKTSNICPCYFSYFFIG